MPRDYSCRYNHSYSIYSSRMGNLPTHIYGYNNEHDVYMVVKDTQWECEQPSYNLKKFWSFTLKRNLGVFELKRGLQHFQKSPFRPRKHWSSANNRRKKLCIFQLKWKWGLSDQGLRTFQFSPFQGFRQKWTHVQCNQWHTSTRTRRR